MAAEKRTYRVKRGQRIQAGGLTLNAGDELELTEVEARQMPWAVERLEQQQAAPAPAPKPEEKKPPKK